MYLRSARGGRIRSSPLDGDAAFCQITLDTYFSDCTYLYRRWRFRESAHH